MGYIKKVRSGKIKHGYRFWYHGKVYESIGYDSKWASMDAEAKRRRELGATYERKDRGPRSPRFSSVVENYVRTVVDKHENRRHERHAFELLTERWGDRPLNSIRVEDVERFKHDVQKHTTKNGTVSGATVNRYLAYLTAFFNWCIKRKLVESNPASAKFVEREPEPPREHPNLSPEQLGKILDAFYDLPIERARLVLLMNLGVRKGVIYSLRWNQVDFENRVIRYETKKGRRRQTRAFTIPMNEAVVAELKHLRELYQAILTPELVERVMKIDHPIVEKMKIYPEIAPRIQRCLEPDGPVFPTTTDTGLKRRWAQVKADLALPKNMRLAHDYRVTFAKTLAYRGHSIKTIQGLLGHTTPTMTPKYVPSDLEAQREAVADLDVVNGNGKNKRRTRVGQKAQVVKMKEQ